MEHALVLMKQNASFLNSNSNSDDSLPSFPFSAISNQRSEIDSSSVLSNGSQIEMQQGLNDHVSQGSFVSEKQGQSEGANNLRGSLKRDTYSVVSGTDSDYKDSVLTSNFRRRTGIKVREVIDEKEEDGESTEPDSGSSVSRFREQFAVPMGMANISSEAITLEKVKILERLNGFIERRSRNLIEWQKSWSNAVLEHRRVGQELWKKLEKMLKETIEYMKEKKEECKVNCKKYKEVLGRSGNEGNKGGLSNEEIRKLLEDFIKKDTIPYLEEIIGSLEKELAWAKGKYERFTWRFKEDEKLEKAVKSFQEKSEGFLNKNETVKGGLFTYEMAVIFQVQNQVNIEEEFGEIMTKILEGVKKIEAKEYGRLCIVIERSNHSVQVCMKNSREAAEEFQIEYEENVEEFIKERYSLESLVDFEGEYEELVEYLGSIKFKLSKYVEENSLLLYQCQGFFYYKEKKLKDNAVRIGLTADGWVIIYEVDAEKRKVEILKQWKWSSTVKIEEHKENKEKVVIEKYGIEFDDILDKKGFLNRFEKFKI